MKSRVFEAIKWVRNQPTPEADVITNYNHYYKYLILQSNGYCIDVADREPVELSRLFADGWRPVRETPFGGTGVATAILIVIRHESFEEIGIIPEDMDDDIEF